MDLSNYRKSDFFIVLSRINTKLRDDYQSLEDLVRSEDLDQEDLIAYFKEHGYSYYPDLKAFKED